MNKSDQPLTSLSRRRVLQLAALAGIAAPAAANSAATLRRTLDLRKPEDNLTALVKMRGSLLPEDSPHWYFGTIYAVLPGKAPIPLVDYEGSEIDYYERQADGSYNAYGATVSFFKDTRTRKWLKTFDNPITGKTVEVRPNTINVRAHYIYSIYGGKRSDDSRPLSTTPVIQDMLKWTESDDHVWLNMRRLYPPGLPMGEDQTIQGSLRELHDPNLPKVYTTASPTYIAPWLSWLDMQDHPGHTVWAGPARKLDSIKQYPRELLDLIEKYHPEKLSAKPPAAKA
jgi:Protein of unknown function (DUF1838)